MARAVAVKSPGGWPAQELEKKMRDARFLVGEDRFVVTFANGKEYSFPRSSLEVDDGSDIINIQLDRKRYYFRVAQTSGNRYEVPWDRVLHEAEPSYPHFRGHVARTNKYQEVGAAIRKLREAKGLTQAQLASAVGMMRTNISRIEAAKHRPSLATVERIAKALKIPVASLIARR